MHNAVKNNNTDKNGLIWHCKKFRKQNKEIIYERKITLLSIIFTNNCFMKIVNNGKEIRKPTWR